MVYYKRNANYVLRAIHDTFFLINISDNYKDEKCALLETNEIGAFIWDNLEQEKTLVEIVELLLQAINNEVSYDIVSNDVSTYLKVLFHKGVVTESVR